MNKDKIEVTTLPITNKFLRQKRLFQDRGELALIEDGYSFQHLGYFSLFHDMGYRGGHYHKIKVEKFYIISGKVRIELYDLELKQTFERILNAGDKASIYPFCAHRFFALKDAQVIEYYNHTYDSNDDIPFDFDTN